MSKRNECGGAIQFDRMKSIGLVPCIACVVLQLMVVGGQDRAGSG